VLRLCTVMCVLDAKQSFKFSVRYRHAVLVLILKVLACTECGSPLRLQSLSSWQKMTVSETSCPSARLGPRLPELYIWKLNGRITALRKQSARESFWRPGYRRSILVLKLALRKQYVRTWIGFMWLRIWFSGGLCCIL
jgi:hypothetical protein